MAGISGWTPRNWWVAAIGLVIASGASAQNPAGDRTDLTPGLVVCVYNFAGVPRTTMTIAEEEARMLFAKAGMETAWHNCPTRANLEKDNPISSEPLGPLHVFLKILPASMAIRFRSRGRDLGFALESAGPGVSSDAWVFYQRIEDLAVRSGTSQSVILGHAMAHEIGHLLLGSGSHSPQGIMRGGWHRPDFERAAEGQLVFTPKQSEKMRRELASRSSTSERASRQRAESLPPVQTSPPAPQLSSSLRQ